MNEQGNSLHRRELSREKQENLETTGINFLAQRSERNEMIQHLQEYKSQFGNLLVPQRYKIQSCDNTINLGKWVSNTRQRHNKGKVTAELKQTLDSMGFVWNVNNNNSDDMIHYLQEYKSQFGNLLVPCNYKIKSCGNTINLGVWVNNARQKHNKGEMNEDLKQTLDLMGFVWNVHNNSDYYMIQHLQVYKSQFGNLLVPFNYRIQTCDRTINLGYWVSEIRKKHRKGTIKDELKETLDSLGFVWTVYNPNDMIQHLQDYKSQFGNLLVPSRYKIHSHSKTINLGTWVHTARQNYKRGKMKDELKETLHSMGFVWDACASAGGRHGLKRQKSSHDPTKPGAHKLTGYRSTQNSYHCHNVSHPCDDFTGSASNETHSTSSLHTPEPKKRKRWRPPTPYPASDDEEVL